MPSLIIKNITRHPFRNFAMILTFAFIAASFFLPADFIMAGATDNIKSALPRLGADLLVVPAVNASQADDIILRGIPSTFYFNNATTDAIARVDGVGQATPQIYLVTLGGGCCSAAVQLIAVDPEPGSHHFSMAGGAPAESPRERSGYRRQRSRGNGRGDPDFLRAPVYHRGPA